MPTTKPPLPSDQSERHRLVLAMARGQTVRYGVDGRAVVLVRRNQVVKKTARLEGIRLLAENAH